MRRRDQTKKHGGKCSGALWFVLPLTLLLVLKTDLLPQVTHCKSLLIVHNDMFLCSLFGFVFGEVHLHCYLLRWISSPMVIMLFLRFSFLPQYTVEHKYCGMQTFVFISRFTWAVATSTGLRFTPEMYAVVLIQVKSLEIAYACMLSPPTASKGGVAAAVECTLCVCVCEGERWVRPFSWLYQVTILFHYIATRDGIWLKSISIYYVK